MSDKIDTCSAKDVIDILNACKDIPVTRIKFKELEVEFSFASVKDNCNIDDEHFTTTQLVSLISDQETSDQTIINNMDELDMLKVADPVAYDLALQGAVDAEGIQRYSRAK